MPNNEKVFEVKIDKSLDVVSKEWESKVFIKLYVSIRTSGLLADISPANLKALINLATFMDEKGQCYPSLEKLAEGLGVSVTEASKRYKKLCEYRWKGKPLVTRKKVRDEKTKRIKGTVYTILADNLKIFDGKPQATLTKEQVGENAEETPTLTKEQVGENAEETPTLTKGNVAKANVAEAQGNKMSVLPSVSQSEALESHPIFQYWRKAFNEDLSELQLEEITSMNVPYEKIKEIIRKIKLYIDIKTTPFAVVARAIAAEARGKSWVFNEDAGEIKPQRPRPEQSSKSQNRPKNTREENIPQVLKEEMEKKENNSTPSQVPAVDPETRARIMDQLSKMRQRLNQRMNEGGGNFQ